MHLINSKWPCFYGFLYCILILELLPFMSDWNTYRNTTTCQLISKYFIIIYRLILFLYNTLLAHLSIQYILLVREVQGIIIYSCIVYHLSMYVCSAMQQLLKLRCDEIVNCYLFSST